MRRAMVCPEKMKSPQQICFPFMESPPPDTMVATLLTSSKQTEAAPEDGNEETKEATKEADGVVELGGALVVFVRHG